MNRLIAVCAIAGERRLVQQAISEQRGAILQAAESKQINVFAD